MWRWVFNKKDIVALYTIGSVAFGFFSYYLITEIKDIIHNQNLPLIARVNTGFADMEDKLNASNREMQAGFRQSESRYNTLQTQIVKIQENGTFLTAQLKKVSDYMNNTLRPELMEEDKTKADKSYVQENYAELKGDINQVDKEENERMDAIEIGQKTLEAAEGGR